MSIEILDCLKRKRDICIKNIIPSQNTAFGFTPALNEPIKNHSLMVRAYMKVRGCQNLNCKLHTR